jgi:hypothetical protein
MSDSETRQAIPLGYDAYEKALEDVAENDCQRAQAGHAPRGCRVGKEPVRGAESSLAEFDAVNFRPGVHGGFAGASETVAR